MQIKINIKNNQNYIHNLAYIKALLINKTIESLNINYDEKIQLKNEVLEYLKNN